MEPSFIDSESNVSNQGLQKPSENEVCPLCSRWDNRPVGVDMVIFKDHQILLIKREKDPDKGKYAVPGGYVDRGESVGQAGVREAREETGLDVEIVALIGIRSNPDRFRQIIEISYLAKVVGGQEAPGDGVESILWVDPNNLPEEMATIGEHDQIVQSALPLLQKLLVGPKPCLDQAHNIDI